jgi:probable phosphoglycerate mutase
MGTTEFLLIRHAETEWNESGRWQGWGDPPLSPRGREQAAVLAAQIAGEALDALLCSNLQRAVETAEAIAKRLGRVVTQDERLRERDVGSWTGLTRAQITERDGELLARFEQRDDPAVCPGGGESDVALERRVRPAIKALVAQYAGRRIAVVTHLGVLRLLLPGRDFGHTEVRRVAL